MLLKSDAKCAPLSVLSHLLISGVTYYSRMLDIFLALLSKEP